MFTGSIVAIITPMDEKGVIDRAGLKKVIDYHVNSGTAAVVSVGTTGESATLNNEEHIKVVMATLELADGRLPVIAGTGANSTAEAISLTKQFTDSGVAGCLTVTPYYNKPTQEGLFQHFKAIAESTDLPQILYNVPGRTGCDMLSDTVARLAEIPNIVSLKDATGNLNRVNQLLELVDENFTLLSGDDASSLDFMQLGGHGVISVTANVAAKEIADICALCAKGDFKQARAINRRLMALHHKLFVESNPIPIKWACKRVGLISTDAMRLPMTSLSKNMEPIVEQALKTAGLI